MAACMPRRGRWRVAGHRSPRRRPPSVGLAWPESVGLALALGQKGNGSGGVVTPKEFHPPSLLPFENDLEDGDSGV